MSQLNKNLNFKNLTMKITLKLLSLLSFFALISVLPTACEKEPCESVFCQNGGICDDGICDCPVGFSGSICEIEDRCITQNVQCQNGGTCVDGTCNCPEGFIGTNCENFDPAKTQLFLDNGRTPLELFNGGIPLDSLYGKNYAGGIIFFVNTQPEMYPNFTGDGLVCTDEDYGDFDEWGCFEVTGATGREVGAGATNTKLIIEKMCARAPKSAIICDELVLNGFDDWFLPSIDEVDLIYHNLHLKGHNNFLGNIRRYQSSTEHDANNFVLRLFWRDEIANISKISGDDIRPTRAF